MNGQTHIKFLWSYLLTWLVNLGMNLLYPICDRYGYIVNRRYDRFRSVDSDTHGPHSHEYRFSG